MTTPDLQRNQLSLLERYEAAATALDALISEANLASRDLKAAATEARAAQKAVEVAAEQGIDKRLQAEVDRQMALIEPEILKYIRDTKRALQSAFNRQLREAWIMADGTDVREAIRAVAATLRASRAIAEPLHSKLPKLRR